MPKDFLAGAKDEYDVIVIGSGLAGLTTANILGSAGYQVLLIEQHYKLGGMATWFKRPQGHVFDVSLHGFPFGMKKSCRRYWNQEIADRIIPLLGVRFDNPQFSLTTPYDRENFTELLTRHFGVEHQTVTQFFDAARNMNFYDEQQVTTGEFFEKFFPGRQDIIRLLMEPITYANGSTLEDPAITYGIVFSNFMSKGVYTFQGGTDMFIEMMHDELKRNNVDVRINCNANKINTRRGAVQSVQVNDRTIRCRSVVSNANLLTTIFKIVGEEVFDKDYIDEARNVRLNNSSTQVYMALGENDSIDPATGDLLFSSTADRFETDLLLSRDITSRTFSFYYPSTRPHANPRHLIVSSTNANWDDWVHLDDDGYKASKEELIDTTLTALEKYVPNARERIIFSEASTPRTFAHYTQHQNGASFGTKFEGLAVSRGLPEQIKGLYHAGSVGIIMSGWLGAINYGVIVSNDVDAQLM
ncbi:MAG: NAD(P)/FAD-dependent oxidoreductase [Planctomycetaceae bacterium]|jgi:phytoene dehydrogenase-like protein|nr:NAD(P)/FAD-dependent oxidoreductase [Planctomycetaceae bacterium]MBT4012749.1 NAD(P)/FAD-dependent oxidoreductase [Planctomycetaceae bacterium]MBT4723753.1 NAD(P)/FAD-dependent oxidoreductase [Planctomycetaceae bacterium]MBT5126070.1 NAD(P)/FAD-dependent oxidoreductase [Planctomycetaceae bacterium]MBT5598032.1 NAD(P)/FAD-dependent oxidoreductase [Planctomycetaceae bacterium]